MSGFMTNKAVSLRTQTLIDKESVGNSVQTKSPGPHLEEIGLDAKT